MSGDLLKLTAYFGERDRAGGRLVGDALLDLYGGRRLETSVLLRGAEGFGALHRLHTDRLLSLSEDLPVVALALDSPARIEQLLDPVLALHARGLVTLERARRLAPGGDGANELARELAGDDEAVKLTVYLGRADRLDGRPAFATACELLHRLGVAGATVLLGVDGTRSGQRMRARFFDRNAQVPLMIVAVGARESIVHAAGELARLLPQAMLTLERVHVCKRDGALLEPPRRLPEADRRGLPLWRKLTVYSSQAATHDGRPLNVEIVRRLRAAGAAGATSLRGIWGFHGAHAPHGERLLQLRRHVPVVTVVLDTPARAARWFAILDELTSAQGLVTSEIVPGLRPGEGVRATGDVRLARPHP